MKSEKYFINYFLFLFILFSTTLPAQQTLTLEKSLEIGFQNSPQIQQVRLGLERSQQLLKAKNASLKSQFSLQLIPIDFRRDKTFNSTLSKWIPSEQKSSSSLFRIAQPIKWTDGTLQLINNFGWEETYTKYTLLELSGRLGAKRTKSFRNNLYLTYNQPIFTYNRTKLELDQLKLDLETTALDYALQKLSMERTITQEFYDAYLQKMSLEIAVEEMHNQEKSHQIMKNKVDAGLAAKEELYQAELNLATSRSTVENAQVTLANALDNFKLLIGIPIFDEITVVTNIERLEVPVDMDKALEHGVNNRLELRQREIDVENSLFNLIQVSANNEFLGNIQLSYGRIGTDPELRNIYNEPSENQQVSLNFEIPLFDWGQKKAQIKASQATIDSRTLSKTDEKNNIIFGIRQAYRQLNNQIKQIEINQQNVKIAQLTYEINLERYENGDLTSMDLSLFQNQLSQKKIDYIAALINYKLSLLNLKIQSLWDFEKNRAAVPDMKFTGE